MEPAYPAARRDPSDALIDAVVAWEALFGTQTEATLRVSGSIARLLHPSGDERRAAQKRIAKIYGLRSRVVHGENVDPAGVYEASREAIGLTRSALRVLVNDYPELVAMTSAERSTRLLML